MGDPLDDATLVGPIINKVQFDRNSRLYRDRPEGRRNASAWDQVRLIGSGRYVEPTIFSGVTPDMAIAREEIFGPVLSILLFDGVDEAIKLANDSIYGLSAGIWTSDLAAAMKAAEELKAGTIWINTYLDGPAELPFGGYGQSGIGRENRIARRRGVHGSEDGANSQSRLSEALGRESPSRHPGGGKPHCGRMNSMEIDYLVIGGGSAGCVVASRLSEDPSVSVGLIEIGARNESVLVNWPAGYAKLQGEKFRWEWMTVPQKHLGDRPMLFPQGKILGGGSTVNSMVYIRGNPRDYDAWADLGNEGWSYDDLLPYFKRSEDNERFCDGYHGIDGPLGVADQRYPIDLTRRFVRAAQEAGIAYTPDFNGAHQSGVGFYQVTQRNVRRSSWRSPSSIPQCRDKTSKLKPRCA